MSQVQIMHLGPFLIAHPFILAPMAGITHSAFRRLMRRKGSPLVISELISANGVEYRSAKTLELFQFHPEERPIGFQIFGEDVKALVNACQYVESIGADFVDLNLGCPVPKIVKKGAGAALCRDTLNLGKILSQMVKSVKIPVTIKIRTGWDQDHRNAHEIIKIAECEGVHWVAIHGRTRAQGYSGLADWEYIGDVKAKSKIPIIGNGDLQTPELAVEMQRKYELDAVMLGRGALRNPFIFMQTKSLFERGIVSVPTGQDYFYLAEELRAITLSIYPERVAHLQMKKFLAWFSSGFPGCHDFRKNVFSSHNIEELWEATRRFYCHSEAPTDPSYLQQSFLMGGHG